MCSGMYRNPQYECEKFKEEEEAGIGAEAGADTGLEGHNGSKNGDQGSDGAQPQPHRRPDEFEIKFKEKYEVPAKYLYTTALSEEELVRHFDDFYRDVFIEIGLKYGQIDDFVVTGNFNHLNGNVFIKFHSEADAERAVSELNSRWYDERPIFAELSPVVSFGDAICGTFEDEGRCSRDHNCNFWHMKKPSGALKRELLRSQGKYRRA